MDLARAPRRTAQEGLWVRECEMTSKSQYEKNLDAFAPYYYDNENHIDSLTPLI